MVSKAIKRTPTKTLKSNRHRHQQQRRKKSPIKNTSAAASVVVASINKSLYTCHRRLIKIFSKFVCIATPKKKSPRKQGYQLLHKANQDPKDRVIKALFDERVPLPPLVSSKKGTVFLDLDETLVHSQATVPPEKCDFIVKPMIDGEKVEFFVLKRPFVDELLEHLSKNYEIVVFTAAIEEYASKVLDRIDPKGLISHRLYRDSCKEVEGKFVKDLSDLGRDLKRVVIVDDNPNSYIFQPENAIKISPFVDDLNDGELKRLVQFFDQFVEIEDMRDVAKNYASQFSEGT